MRKTTGGVGFHHEAFSIFLFRFGVQACSRDHLDGDGSPQLGIACAINYPHGAASKLGVNCVSIQTCAYTSGHDGMDGPY